MQIQSLDWKDPLEEEMVTYSSILPGKSHGQRSLTDYSPWSHKESDMTGQLTVHTHTHTHNNTLYLVGLYSPQRYV